MAPPAPIAAKAAIGAEDMSSCLRRFYGIFKLLQSRTFYVRTAMVTFHS